jgi:hypothetical protein
MSAQFASSLLADQEPFTFFGFLLRPDAVDYRPSARNRVSQDAKRG